MVDDPSCVATDKTLFHYKPIKHSLHGKCGLCFFAFLRRFTGV